MKLALYLPQPDNVGIPNHITKGSIMNIAKNMEIFFVAALAFAGFATYAAGPCALLQS
jgi:hypothetical protein